MGDGDEQMQGHLKRCTTTIMQNSVCLSGSTYHANVQHLKAAFPAPVTTSTYPLRPGSTPEDPEMDCDLSPAGIPKVKCCKLR